MVRRFYRPVPLVGAVHSGRASRVGADYVHCRDVTSRQRTARRFYLDELALLKNLVEGEGNAAAFRARGVDFDWESTVKGYCIETAKKMINKLAANPGGSGHWFYFMWALIEAIWARDQAFTPRPPGATWRNSITRVTHRMQPVFAEHLAREVGLLLYNILFYTIN